MLAAAFLTCTLASARAEVLHFHARLTPEGGVPPTSGSGSGVVRATLDTVTRAFSWSISYESLSGPARGGGFHSPASPKENAPSVIDLSGNFASPIEGTTELSAEMAKNVLDGVMYLEIRTDKFPKGEIRGQLVQGELAVPT
jgi:hypothetical protein